VAGPLLPVPVPVPVGPLEPEGIYSELGVTVFTHGLQVAFKLGSLRLRLVMDSEATPDLPGCIELVADLNCA
jgi:hypothetical protein